MTENDVQEFVTRFAAAWAARDGEAFLALWHPDGLLIRRSTTGRWPARSSGA